jgi:hypothetical protein
VETLYRLVNKINKIINASEGYIDYVGLDMYREWKKIGFPKEYCI